MLLSSTTTAAFISSLSYIGALSAGSPWPSLASSVPGDFLCSGLGMSDDEDLKQLVMVVVN